MMEEMLTQYEPSPAGDGGEEHREHALVPGRARLGGANIVGADEKGDPQQQHAEDSDDDGERKLRGFGHGVTKRLDAIAHGFHAGHGGASAGEGFQDEPRAKASGGGRQDRRRDHRVRMRSIYRYVPDSNGYESQKTNDEQIGGQHEDAAGFAHAAEVDDGSGQKNAEAEDESVRMQAGHGGNERAHP